MKKQADILKSIRLHVLQHILWELRIRDNPSQLYYEETSLRLSEDEYQRPPYVQQYLHRIFPVPLGIDPIESQKIGFVLIYV